MIFAKNAFHDISMHPGHLIRVWRKDMGNQNQ